MKGHTEIQANLAVYDSLSVTARGEVDEHLCICPDCAERLTEYRRMDRKLARLQDPWLGQQVTRTVEAVLAGQPMPSVSTHQAKPIGAQRISVSRSLTFQRLLLPVGMILVLLTGLWMRMNIPMRASQDARPTGSTGVAAIAKTPIPTSPSLAASAPNDAFAYGVAAQVYDGMDTPSVAILAKGIGFEWVKIEVPWKQFEPQKGQRNWQELDRIIAGLTGQQANLRILATIADAPAWARLEGDLSVDGPPANPADYASFAAAFGARYAGRVQAIEVWDEQNMEWRWNNQKADPKIYTELLCAAYKAIKATAANVSVISGGLTALGGEVVVGYDDVKYLNAMYQVGAGQCFDALGAHPAGYNNPPDAKYTYRSSQASIWGRARGFFFRETLEAYRQAMITNDDADKAIWVTQFGWASAVSPKSGYTYAKDNTRIEQAEYIVRAFQMGQEWGWVGPMFLWNLNYGAKNPNREEAYFDITLREARPTYDALKTLIGSEKPQVSPNGRFIWPATGYVTQKFTPSHPAIDIVRAIGTPVKAADAGQVVVAGWQNADEANVVVIDHGNGWQTCYVHLNKVSVKVGQQVARGALIGEMGSTSHSADPLLHFEVIRDGVKLNPISYLP